MKSKLRYRFNFNILSEHILINWFFFYNLKPENDVCCWYMLATPLKTPIQTLSSCFRLTTAILLHGRNVFDTPSWQWFHDLNLPLTTSEVWAYFPSWVKVVQSKTYNPAAGAVNIPVATSYPLPLFRSTVSKTTRPFVARLLTWFFSRTSKPTIFLSKIWTRFLFEIK